MSLPLVQNRVNAVLTLSDLPRLTTADDLDHRQMNVWCRWDRRS